MNKNKKLHKKVATHEFLCARKFRDNYAQATKYSACSICLVSHDVIMGCRKRTKKITKLAPNFTTNYFYTTPESDEIFSK
jgi:hypothetical protein